MAGGHAVNAVNTHSAKAALRLSAIQRVATLAATAPRVNRVTGLLDMHAAPTPTCRQRLGSASGALTLQVARAPGSSLLVECPHTARLTINNTNGACVQAMLARAPHMVVVGRGVTIFPSPTGMPSRVDVGGVLAAPRGGGPTVVVQLSLLRSHGNMLRKGGTVVKGRLGFPVRSVEEGVIVYGCGAKRKVVCKVVDAVGKAACKQVERCVDAPAAARTHVGVAMRVANWCKSPA